MRLLMMALTVAGLSGCGLMLDSAPDGGSNTGIDAATPQDGGERARCGSNVCEVGLECCNESCGLCARPGEGCVAVECLDAGAPDAGSLVDAGLACGATTCSPAQLCCPGCDGDAFCASGSFCPDIACAEPCLTSADCGPTERCQRRDGVCEGEGTCAPRPTSCPEDCPGVCSCSGVTYCNGCRAQMDGAQAEHARACSRPRACGPQDARSAGGCLEVIGYAWNGFYCAAVNCACEGTECDRLFRSAAACQLEHDDCSCGGIAGLLCADDEFCQYPMLNSCGSGDMAGGCRPRPDACPPVVMPVCGCDGDPYPSPCDANRAGTDVGALDGCSPAAP